mmetsp:Transcript_24131/g.33458  ORF Transcript_24131/g.33458 Transcript_24131/m.33458 type:complete len:246 (+) Transcript_24131:57-794(+)|eukprot:jgi/Bigna1/89885/estExt_fgenesh1_pg.C_570065
MGLVSSRMLGRAESQTTKNVTQSITGVTAFGLNKQDAVAMILLSQGNRKCLEESIILLRKWKKLDPVDRNKVIASIYTKAKGHDCLIAYLMYKLGRASRVKIREFIRELAIEQKKEETENRLYKTKSEDQKMARAISNKGNRDRVMNPLSRSEGAKTRVLPLFSDERGHAFEDSEDEMKKQSFQQYPRDCISAKKDVRAREINMVKTFVNLYSDAWYSIPAASRLAYALGIPKEMSPLLRFFPPK